MRHPAWRRWGGCGIRGSCAGCPACADAVALTFDDGPHPEGTPAVLAELERLGMRATFYVVATQARRYPGLLRDVVAAGHELGLHGGRHLPHALVPPFVLERELARAGRDRGPRRGRAANAARAVRRGQPLDPAVRDAKRDAASSAGRGGDATGSGGRLRRRSRGGWPRARRRATSCSCTTPTPTRRPGSWRRTAAALPEVAELLATRGLRATTVGEVRRRRRCQSDDRHHRLKAQSGPQRRSPSLERQ